MKQTSFFITTVILSSVAAMAGDQSLADMARKEAERRKGLERIEEKVIEGGSPTQLAPGGNLTTSSSPSKGSRRQRLAGEARASPGPIRNRIRKLDREIAETDERIAALRSRIERERWAPTKAGRRSQTKDSPERLRTQLQELELRRKRLGQERLETYDQGRKAGFLPGELDGKGIIP